MPKLTRGYLITVAVLFYLPMGGALLIEPASLFERIGMVLGSALAAEEVRASHGGVWLITGLLCLLATWRARWIPYALSFLLVYNGGYAVGRLVSFGIGDAAVSDLLPLFAFDIVLVAISSTLLVRWQGE